MSRQLDQGRIISRFGSGCCRSSVRSNQHRVAKPLRRLGPNNAGAIDRSHLVTTVIQLLERIHRRQNRYRSPISGCCFCNSPPQVEACAWSCPVVNHYDAISTVLFRVSNFLQSLKARMHRCLPRRTARDHLQGMFGYFEHPVSPTINIVSGHSNDSPPNPKRLQSAKYVAQ